MIKWITENGNLINLGLTFVLVFITCIYVYLTYRLVHTPYKVNMRIGFNIQSLATEEICRIFFYNFGPGMAINILIKYSTPGGITLFEYIPEVKPRDETGIELNACLIKIPIYIKWNSVTGKSQKVVYRIKNGRMTRIGLFERAYFFIKQIVPTKKRTRIIKGINVEQENSVKKKM